MEQEQFKFTNGVILYPVLFVLIIWAVFWFEVRFGIHLNEFGIYPKTFKGLRGVIFSPFIHGSVEHLYHNTMPLLVLSTAVFYFYQKISWKIIIYGILISGFLTWCIGRPANHIGASGLIYVLMSFTLFKGIFSRHYRLTALSFMVIFLYGSMIWYVFPVKEQISWEGHLAGLITGLFFALIFRKSIAQKKRYAWEKEDYDEDNDPFLKHFDDDGNFIEHLHEEQDHITEEQERRPSRKIIYHIKKVKKDNNSNDAV